MSSLEKNIINAFKDALGQVPQRVLWKYEGEMEDKPKNVMTKEWFPQRDILGKVKLFSTIDLLILIHGTSRHGACE